MYTHTHTHTHTYIFIQTQALCSRMSVRSGDISKQAGSLTNRLNAMRRSEFNADMKSIQGGASRAMGSDGDASFNDLNESSMLASSCKLTGPFELLSSKAHAVRHTHKPASKARRDDESMASALLSTFSFQAQRTRVDTFAATNVSTP